MKNEKGGQQNSRIFFIFNSSIANKLKMINEE